MTVLWLDGTRSDIWQIPVTTNKPVYTLHTPYGGKRNQNVFNQRTGSKGFVGGIEDDQLGLYRIGVRDYNPVLARFITTAPITDTSDPLQWGIYSYANWDPINNTDSTEAWDCLDKVWNKTKEVVSNAANAVKEVVTSENAGWMTLDAVVNSGIGIVTGYVVGVVAGAVCGVSIVCGIVVGGLVGAAAGGLLTHTVSMARYNATNNGWLDRESYWAVNSLEEVRDNTLAGTVGGAVGGIFGGGGKVLDTRKINKLNKKIDSETKRADKAEAENAELRKRVDYLENMTLPQFLKMRITKKMRMFMD